MSILGIDIGGTKTTVGLADSSGRILAKTRFATPQGRGPAAEIEETGRAADLLFTETDQRPDSVEGIGIACGGPLDIEAGRIILVPNIPGWEDFPIASILSEKFGAPAWLDNDATAAAFGEAAFGAGKGVSDFVYFTISTGIGGGIIINGRPYRGLGNAGEFGHQTILPGGPVCTCGDCGCLEALASGTSIAREAASRLKEHPDSVLSAWTDGGKVTAEMVARAAREGDKYASEVWNAAMRYLAIGIANVVTMLHCRLVILGGGVTLAGDQLFGPLRAFAAQRAISKLGGGVRIVPAGLGQDSGVVGAVTLALEKLGRLCHPERSEPR